MKEAKRSSLASENAPSEEVQRQDSSFKPAAEGRDDERSFDIELNNRVSNVSRSAQPQTKAQGFAGLEE